MWLFKGGGLEKNWIWNNAPWKRDRLHPQMCQEVNLSINQTLKHNPVHPLPPLPLWSSLIVRRRRPRLIFTFKAFLKLPQYLFYLLLTAWTNIQNSLHLCDLMPLKWFKTKFFGLLEEICTCHSWPGWIIHDWTKLLYFNLKKRSNLNGTSR